VLLFLIEGGGEVTGAVGRRRDAAVMALCRKRPPQAAVTRRQDRLAQSRRRALAAQSG